MLKPIFDSIVRTVVPMAVGPVVLWAATRFSFLGIDADAMTPEAIVWVSGALSSGYYVIARVVETRWPSFGWLLGKPGAPTYGDLES